VAFSLNSWIYKGNYTVDCTIPKCIWTRAHLGTCNTNIMLLYDMFYLFVSLSENVYVKKRVRCKKQHFTG